MNKEGLMPLFDGQNPVKVGLLIMVLPDRSGEECGVQVPREEDIRWHAPEQKADPNEGNPFGWRV
jgi:hypothetical protein